MGTVEIAGKVNIAQFWPEGNSDVDTVQFDPCLASARYFPDAGSPTNVEAYFREGGVIQPDDYSPGRTKFRRLLRGLQGALTVRLQGIDAPELHYSPNYREGMFNGDYPSWVAKHIARSIVYRQPYAKWCVDAFASGIRRELGLAPKAQESSPILDAQITINADGINSCVDVYGRILGSLTIFHSGRQLNLNDYALSEGYAFCSFYGNMKSHEIVHLNALYRSHEERGARKSALRSNVSTKLLDFEPGLWESRSAEDRTFDRNGNGGFRSRCFEPKLFRRCVDWIGRREALRDGSELLTYMRENDELVCKLSDFLDAGCDWALAPKHCLGAFIDQSGTIVYSPGDIVYESRPVVVINERGDPLPGEFS